METTTHRKRDIYMGIMGMILMMGGGIILEFGHPLGWGSIVFGAVLYMNYTTFVMISREEYEETQVNILGGAGLLKVLITKSDREAASQAESDQKNASVKGKR